MPIAQPSTRVSPASASSTVPTLSPELVSPFRESIRAVFERMIGVKVVMHEARPKAHPSPTHAVCGIIGFSGQICGSIVLSLSDQAAEGLVEAFAGVKLPRDSADFADAVGELANMIAGGAKKDLGGAASISVPSVVIGPPNGAAGGYTIAAMSGSPCMVLPCESPFGQFSVEIAVKRNPAG